MLITTMLKNFPFMTLEKKVGLQVLLPNLFLGFIENQKEFP